MTAAHFAPLYVEQIASCQQRLAEVRAWTPSTRRDAIIAELEQTIEDHLSCLELGAEIETVAYEGEIETSEKLDAAVERAQVCGAALVTGAHDLARELDRIAPGCCTALNGVEVRTVQIDGGTLRMTRAPRSYQARMTWSWT
jgi:hypothetical protein